MGRPGGKNNIMRSVEEKEKIVLEYLNGNQGLHQYEKKYEISYSVLHDWYVKYQERGIDGLKSRTGKKTGQRIGRPKTNITEEEKLKQIIMKQEIEIARLKKGYMVKGVGDQKEYITTFDENTK